MRTTIGRLLVNEALPPPMRDYAQQFNKKTLDAVLTRVAEERPEDYPDTVYKLKQFGDNAAFEQGASYSLADLAVPVDKKKAFAQADKKADNVRMKMGLSKTERDSQISQVYSELNTKLTEDTIRAATKNGNGLAKMIVSGAKGKPGQLMQMITAPVLFSDHKQRPIPLPVKHSYAEGLDPAEYWISSYGVRRGAISTKFATADAGAFAKQLAQATVSMVVTERDCGTTNGIPTTPEDRDNAGAYFAKSVGGFPAGSLITPEVLAELKKRGVGTFLVRSPTTCEAKKGVCAKCYGHDEFSKLPVTGRNVGVLAAQTMGEPITQMSMRVKHSGGVASDRGVASGYKLLNQLTSIPKEFPGRASLSTVTGTVDKIEKAPQGGTNVYVGGHKHYVLTSMEPTVKVGDKVEEGDSLDTGLVNPSEVVKYKGVGEGRLHIVNALRDAYQDSGVAVNRRHLEVMARSLVNQAQVDTGDIVEGALPDDIVDFQHLQNTYHAKDSSSKSPADALGKYLTKTVLHYTVGTKLLPSMVKQLEDLGVTEVEVSDEMPPFRPMMLRLAEAPHVGEGWTTSLYSRNLKKVIQKAVSRGESEPVHGTSFVASLAHPETFGKSPRGAGEY